MEGERLCAARVTTVGDGLTFAQPVLMRFFASHQLVRRKEKQAVSYSDFMSCARLCVCTCVRRKINPFRKRLGKLYRRGITKILLAP